MHLIRRITYITVSRQLLRKGQSDSIILRRNMGKSILFPLFLFFSFVNGEVDSVYGQYDLAAIATDARPCAEIGT